jgi:heme/copper-type cytochrome/quinol oxidase subunit 1
MVIFSKQYLSRLFSIAIWNKNKVAVVMAISVWGANVVFLIEGASLPFPSTAGHIMYASMIRNRYRPGEPWISIIWTSQFQVISSSLAALEMGTTPARLRGRHQPN